MGEDIRNCRDVEAQLTPYVDGESRGETARAIDAHLSACPPCRHQADAERGGRDLVRECRDSLRAAAPASLRERCSAQARGHRHQMLRRWVPLSLAATLLLAAFGAIAFTVTNPAEAFAAGLTLDHMKCFHVCDTDHPLDATAAATEWKQLEGWTIDVPPAEPAQDLELVSVRRCMSTTGLAAHLLYKWHGQPLSVYVVPHASDGENVIDQMGHETAVWTNGGRTYAVVTPGHPQAFPEIVTYVKAHAR